MEKGEYVKVFFIPRVTIIPFSSLKFKSKKLKKTFEVSQNSDTLSFLIEDIILVVIRISVKNDCV